SPTTRVRSRSSTSTSSSCTRAGNFAACCRIRVRPCSATLSEWVCRTITNKTGRAPVLTKDIPLHAILNRRRQDLGRELREEIHRQVPVAEIHEYRVDEITQQTNPASRLLAREQCVIGPRPGG